MNVLIDKTSLARTSARPGSGEATVVRFAGDSGDGIQLAGLQFARTAAAAGAGLMTLPEFPAEIRAPAGTTFGVSAYQVQFGPGEVLTPGDSADVLVAFNPAALVTNLGFLKPAGTLVVDEGAFTTRNFAKANLAADPVTPTIEAAYRVLRVDITKRTLEAVEPFGLGRKDATRARNFWALGLALWLCSQDTSEVKAWIAKRFAGEPAVAEGNAAAVAAGHAYGETMEIAQHAPGAAAPTTPAGAQMISGTDAMALGVAAVSALSGRPIKYCSYPITPASALLHALARLKTGVTTFQAEDEIAAICAAIGASYGGAIGVSASSGPGLALKTEGLGLAVAAELPLIVVDVQRAGPSTGMPTKPEQSDLDMAVYGRHGEAPIPVLAPATPEDGFWVMIDAARLALAAMSPVLVLSDAYLANAIGEWTPPDVADLAEIAASPVGEDGAHARNAATLALPWVTPGTPGLAYRVGGIEKDASTGNISYDPANHEAMVALRADKVARAAARTRQPFLAEGPEEGDVLVIGWGSTFGSVRQAVRNLSLEGASIAHLHLRQVWPLPADLAPRLARYRKVVCAEMNTGQLARIIRAETLCPVEPVTQLTGRPFRVDTLQHAFASALAEVRS